MLEANKAAAIKFGIDTQFIEEKTDTQRNVEILGDDLTFIRIREFQRTKHVHRLHPYLGKFIPQLVEVFLKRYFTTGDTILDPCSGSGTALIEANVLGMNSVGIELSPFNVLIQEVKARKYNISEVEREIKDALKRLKVFSRRLQIKGKGQILFDDTVGRFETDSEYLKEWFSDRALQEILFLEQILFKRK